MAFGNPFDEALGSLENEEQQQRRAPGESPFDRALSQALDEVEVARDTRLKAATSKPAKSPEQAADIYKLARRFGVAPAYIERHFDTIRQRADQLDTPYARMRQESPALAELIEEQPDVAPAIQDDLAQLGYLEWIVTAPGRAFARSLAQMRAAALRTQSLYRPLTELEQIELQVQKLHAEEGGKLGAATWFGEAVTGGSELLANILAGGWTAAPHIALGAGVGGLIGLVGGGAVTGGPGAVPGAAAGAKFGAGVGGLLGGAQFGFELEAGLAYDEFLEMKDPITGARMDPDAARAAAFAAGALNAGLESLGLGILARSIPGVKQLTGALGRDAVKAALKNPTVRAGLAQAVKEYGGVVTSETAVEVAQRAITIIAGELGKSATGGMTPLSPSQVGVDLLEEAKAAALGFALVGLPGPALTAAAAKRRAEAAERGRDFFTVLGEGAAQSATIKRLPEAAQQLLEKATKDGPVATLYAPIDTFTEYWQGQGVDPRAMAAELTGDADAYDRALAAGADLAIPTAKYAVTIAGTTHNGFFVEELRLGPDEMNAREAKAYREQQQRLAEELAATPPDDAVTSSSIVSEFARKGVEALKAVGFDPGVAEQYGRLLDFGALEQRAGTAIVEQVLGKTGLGVQRGSSRAAGQAARTGVEAPAGGQTPAAGAIATPGATAPAAVAVPGPSAAPADAAPAGAVSPVEDTIPPGGSAGTIVPADPIEAAVSAALEPLPSTFEPATLPPGGDQARQAAEAGEAGAEGQAVPQVGDEQLEPGADARGRDDVRGPGPEHRAPGAERPVHARSRAARTEGRGTRAIPDTYRPRFQLLAADARERGFDGTDDSLADLFLDALEDARRIQADLTIADEEADTGRQLLQEISRAGGFGIDAEGESGMRGELEQLLENLNRRSKNTAVIKRGPRAGETITLPPRQAGGLPGIPNIVRRKDGLPADTVREIVQSDPRWARFENLSEFLQAVNDAILVELGVMERPGVSTFDLEGILTGALGVDVGVDWWADFETVDPAEATLNASGESAASLEALRRQQGMQARGEQFVVYSRTGERRPLIGPDAVDYVAQDGEAYGVEGPHGFRVLDDRGGRYPRETVDLTSAVDLAGFEELAAGEVDLGSLDTSVNIEELEQGLFDELERQAAPTQDPASGVDRLSTGELQPRLPGDVGAVREQEVQQPELGEVGFSLERQAAERGSVQETLFGTPIPPAKPTKKKARDVDPNQTELFQEGRAFVEELEQLATDEAMGVEFDDDGQSTFQDGSAAIVCTNCAEQIIRLVGRGEVWGWEEGTNPTSEVAGPTRGARLDDGQGHDFAIIDGRYLVDAWAKNVEGSSERAAFDLLDVSDRAEVLRLYGDPATWLRRTAKGFVPDTVPALEQEPIDTSAIELDQPAYHGSPHVFEKFSLQHIGTGEGAQAYGWGLYFASRRDVAEEYRRRLAGKPKPAALRLDGTDLFDTEIGLYYTQWEKLPPATVADPVSTWAATTKKQSSRVQQGILELHTRTTIYKPRPGLIQDTVRPQLERSAAGYRAAKAEGRTFSGDPDRDAYDLDRIEAALEVLDTYGEFFTYEAEQPAGRLFTVEIPEDDVLLDWDVRASKQPAKVQEALRALGIQFDELRIPTPAQAMRTFESAWLAQLAYSDIGIRESINYGYRAARHALEWQAAVRNTGQGQQFLDEALEQWEYWYTHHAGLMRSDRNNRHPDPVGERLYGEIQRIAEEQYRDATRRDPLAMAPGPGGRTVYNPPTMAERARMASELLRAHGVVGTRYRHGDSRGGNRSQWLVTSSSGMVRSFSTKAEADAAAAKIPGATITPPTATHNFVIFDDALVEVVEYNQAELELTDEQLQAFAGELKQRTGPDLVELDLRLNRSGSIQLETIAIRKGATRAGLGSSVLMEIVRFADQHQKRIELSLADKGYHPSDDAATTSSPAALRRFYKRFGFVENKGRAKRFDLSIYTSMYREPTLRAGKGGLELGQQQPTSRPTTLEELRARGFDTTRVFYHQTAAAHREPIVTEGFDLAKGRARLSDQEVPDGVFFKPTAQDIGLGAAKPEDQAQIPVYIRFGKLLDVDERADLKAAIGKLEGGQAYLDAVADAEAYDRSQAPRFDELFNDRRMTRGSDAEFEAADAELKVFLEAWRAENDRRAGVARAIATDVLRRAGFESVIIRRDRGSLGRVTETIITIAGDQVALAEPGNERILFQPEQLEAPPIKGRRRGSIRFGKDRQFVISLFEDADLSTFLHEVGHFYLEVFSDIADAVRAVPADQTTAAQRQLLGDYQQLLEWLGVTSRDQIGREHHEKFARGFEAYLMEGQAPSLSLRETFAKFRAWLIGVYRSLRALNVELTPDVRKVLDRMVATDAAIFQAEQLGAVTPMFLSPQAAGMTADEFALYSEHVTRASQTAREQLEVRLLAEVQREQEREWQEKRAGILEEIRKDVHARPVYRAIAAMQRGTTPAGEPLLEDSDEPIPMKLDRARLVALFGEERLKRLPRPYIYTREGGYDPDVVADMFGFSSADELLTAVENAAPMKQVIEYETDQRMLAEHGSILLDGTLHEKATAALANDDREMIVRAELRALANLRRLVKPFVEAGEQRLEAEQRERAYERRWLAAEARLKVAKKQEEIDALRREVANLRARARGGAATIRAAVPSDQVVRNAARDQIAAMRIRDIKPAVFWSASRKAAARAVEAAARQDFTGAIAMKQQELLGLALYREATRVLEEVEARARKVRDGNTPAARGRRGLAGESYLDQWDAILDRYNFARATQKALDRRAKLEDWIRAQQEEGLPIDLPEELLNEARRTPWQELTVEAFMGVTDGLDQILHFARLKNRLLKRQQDRELEAEADAIAESIAAHAKRKRPSVVETRLPAERIRAGITGFFAWQRKLPSIVRQMDGGQDGGVLWEAIMRPINEAVDQEAVEQAKAATQLEAAIGLFSTADRAELFRRRHMPALGTSISRAGRLMIALNWGNAGNRQRLMSGYGWTEEQVRTVLDSLEARDWEFVQAVWALVGSFGPAIVEKQKRVYGVAPELVTATPFMTRFGEMPGGYFPIKYNPDTDRKAFGQAIEEQAKAMMAGAVTQSTTRRGHTKDRVAVVKGRKVLLDFSVIWQHVNEVIHDLTHHEMLIDVNRLLRHPKVHAAIRDHYGVQVYREMQAALTDIAAGDIPVQHHGERALEWLRVGTSIARMGWNLMTSTVQPLGLTVSARRIGPKWLARGAAAWLGGAVKMEHTVRRIHELSSFMRFRHQTMTREVREIQGQIAPRGSWALATFGKRVAGDAGATAGQAVAEKYAAIEDTYFWFIQRAQMIADVPTWLGAFEKAKAAGNDEARAVLLADQAVIDSQGSGHIKDLAHSQRGTPALKLFTQFMGYFSVVYNNGAEAVGVARMSPAKLGRLAVDLLVLYTVPMLLEEAIRDAVRGHDDDDNDEGVLLWFAKNQAAYALNTVVFARELSGVLQGYPYSGPAGAGVFAELARLYVQLEQAEADEALLRALNQVAGVLFHYPATQVERMVRTAIALEKDGAEGALGMLGRKPE